MKGNYDDSKYNNVMKVNNFTHKSKYNNDKTKKLQ
jgi:hypothetical protein